MALAPGVGVPGGLRGAAGHVGHRVRGVDDAVLVQIEALKRGGIGQFVARDLAVAVLVVVGENGIGGSSGWHFSRWSAFRHRGFCAAALLDKLLEPFELGRVDHAVRILVEPVEPLRAGRLLAGDAAVGVGVELLDVGFKLPATGHLGAQRGDASDGEEECEAAFHG